MGYMKQIDIEAQNIFEGIALYILDQLDYKIDVLCNKELSYAEEEALTRLYYLYQLIQLDFWVATKQDIKNLKDYCKDGI